MALTRDQARAQAQLRSAYQAGTGRIRATVLRQLQAVWASSPGYRDGDVDRLLQRLLPLVQAGQIQVAQLTSAYLARQAAELRGVPYEPVPVDRGTVTAPRGIDPREVYRRPAVELYTALSKGASYTEAVDRGMKRLRQIGGIDLQLAKTQQASASLSASGAQWYRRVLSGSENCELCVLAATQRYRVGGLAPIHGGCDCGVEELPVREDPGQIIDQALLDEVYAKAGNDPDTARRTTLRIEEHGELGPVLTVVGQRFTGPAALDPNL